MYRYSFEISSDNDVYAPDVSSLPATEINCIAAAFTITLCDIALNIFLSLTLCGYQLYISSQMLSNAVNAPPQYSFVTLSSISEYDMPLIFVEYTEVIFPISSSASDVSASSSCLSLVEFMLSYTANNLARLSLTGFIRE